MPLFRYLLLPISCLDLLAEHAIGGIIGLLFNAFFADKSIIALDGVNTSANGGWLNRNWKQLYIQIGYIAACVAYSFVVTAAIAKGINYIPHLQLRASPDEEALGMDDIEVRCHLHWTFADQCLTMTIDSQRSASSPPTTSKSVVTTPTGRPSTLVKHGATLKHNLRQLLGTATAPRTTRCHNNTPTALPRTASSSPLMVASHPFRRSLKETLCRLINLHPDLAKSRTWSIT